MTNMQRHIQIYSTLYCLTFYYIKRITNSAPNLFDSRDKASSLRALYHSGISYIKQGRAARLDTSILSVHMESVAFCGRQGTE